MPIQLSFDTISPVTTYFEEDTLYLVLNGEYTRRQLRHLGRQILNLGGIKDVEVENTSTLAIRFRNFAIIEDVRYLSKALARDFIAFWADNPLHTQPTLF